VAALVLLLPPTPAGASTSRPVVYLTFDDGPSGDGSTDDVLAVLARYDVRATFFVVGRRVTADPDRLRRVVAAGHAVGNHTADHPVLTAVSDASIADQFARVQQLVADTTGVTPTCYRAPYGANDARVARVAAEQGLSGWHWTRGGADYRATSSATLAVLRGARDGDVILLHDGPTGRSATVAALRSWLAEAADRYEFRVLPGCGGRAEPAEVDQPWQRPESQVRRLYAAVFGRTPDPVGYAYWVAELLQGRRTLDAVAAEFVRSPEFAATGVVGDDAFVTFVYRSTLGRDPDPAGFAYWTGQLAAGSSRGAVLLGFSESPEFLVRSLPLVTGACAGPDVAAAYRCAPL